MLSACLVHAEIHLRPGDSLAAAAERVRSQRRIIVHGGDYFLDAPWTLGPQESGITIEAASGERPVFHGGRRITGWQREGARFWTAAIDPAWDFRMLVVNGRFTKPARLPESGAFTHLSEFKIRWMGTSGGGWQRKPTEEELTTLRYKSEDLGAWLDVASAELTVYHMWDESLVRLKANDTDQHILTFANPPGHPPGGFGVQKYVVWNIREGMTQPGQWYLDRGNHKLYYWPLENEDMASAVVLAPTVESVLRIAGTKENPVSGVTLRGLSFSITNTPPIAGGFGAGRFDGAVSMTFCDGCVLDRLTVFNTGGQGIKGQNVSNSRVAASEVRDTGACGIIVRGEDNVIEDNHVHDVGRTYPSAIGIYSGGKNLLIQHNEVHDTPYSAVNFSGQGSRVERNLIYRAMLELHDGAAFYIIFGKDCAMRGNLVRDIPDTGGYGSSAYYLDELSENCVVEDNVSIGVARPSHNHMAKRNIIRNNIFLIDGDARLTFPKSSDFRFERNVIASKGKLVFQNFDAIAESTGNVVWSDSRVLEGLPPGTLIARPLVKENEGVYDFETASPAAALGIRPVNVSGAGRRNRKDPPRPRRREELR
jgi:hypothetical protein